MKFWSIPLLFLISSDFETKTGKEEVEEFFRENPVPNMNEAENVQYYIDKIEQEKKERNSKSRKPSNSSYKNTHAKILFRI